jgi:predicted transcriptional regulator
MPNLADQPNYRVPWSETDLAELAAAIRRGDTIRDIARAMGRSQEAVRNRATSAGLMKKRVVGPLSKAARMAAVSTAAQGDVPSDGGVSSG